MADHVIGKAVPLCPQALDGTREIGGVPQDDGTDHQGNPTEALFRKDKSYLKFLGRVTAGATGQASDEADSEALSEGSDGPGDMAFRSDGRAVGVGELGIGQVFG